MRPGQNAFSENGQGSLLQKRAWEPQALREVSVAVDAREAFSTAGEACPAVSATLLVEL